MTIALDLPPYVGQRSATFRFGLVNGVTGEVLTDLHPISNPPAVLTHDTSRTIKRQLTLTLDKTDTARVDVVQSRVLPYMIIGGVEYPLGRFMFSDQTNIELSQGNISSVVLLDEMNVLDQQIESTITPFTANGFVGVTTLLQQVLDPFDLPYHIDPSNYTTNGSWPPGTNRGNVLDDLSLEGNYFSPWFDNDGILRFETAFDPVDAVSTFNWDDNKVVYRGTMVRSNDLLNAPNRFIVISNTTSSSQLSVAPIVGRYDVPDSAPWSIANRGFVIPRVIERGTDSTVHAQVVANNIGQRQLVFERYEVDTAPDPRHDSYDVVTWQGEKWLELAWTLVCEEGAAMHHTLRKAFK